MAHYQTQPYLRSSSSTLSTAERGGQQRRRENDGTRDDGPLTPVRHLQQQPTSTTGPPSSSSYASPQPRSRPTSQSTGGGVGSAYSPVYASYYGNQNGNNAARYYQLYSSQHHTTSNSNGSAVAAIINGGGSRSNGNNYSNRHRPRVGGVGNKPMENNYYNQEAKASCYNSNNSTTCSNTNGNLYDNDNDDNKYARRKGHGRKCSGGTESSSSWVYLIPFVILSVLVLALALRNVRTNNDGGNGGGFGTDGSARKDLENVVGTASSASSGRKVDRIQSTAATSSNVESTTSEKVSNTKGSASAVNSVEGGSNAAVTEEAGNRLRGGMTKHERAAAALLLADIIVHAEHEAEEEMATASAKSTATGTQEDARTDANVDADSLSSSSSNRLGLNDEDYLLMASNVAGAGYAYLPYEIDALDCTNFAVGVWVKPNNISRQSNRVIWSTLPPGTCGGPRRTIGNNLHDDIAGMELSIAAGEVKLSYVRTNGSCESVSAIGHKVQYDEWNHIGVVVTDKSIKLYQNGNDVGLANTAAGRTARAKHSHNDPLELPSYRPKGKMIRTFVGQRADGTDLLDGRVALMSIWAANEELRDDIMQISYESGRRKEGQDGQNGVASDVRQDPTYFYPFDGETSNGVKLDAASKLRENKTSRHGTVRRHVPVEQYTQSTPGEYAEYASGTNQPRITQKMKEDSNDIARSRRVHVRNALHHAWEGYRTEAWGHDELLPVSGGIKDNWGGMGTTLVDSLSTLWLCGLRDEFWEARDWVRTELTFDTVGAVSVFETTIRSLGGLLSAFDLSGDQTFLEKADDLASRLMKAFEHSPSGIPYGEVVLNGDQAYNTRWHSSTAILSELGTMQLELRYLSQATGKEEYGKKALQVIDTMEKMKLSNGLYYLYINNEANPPKFDNRKISFGAMGDSFYEYLLKLWIQGGRKEMKYRRMYDDAMDGMHKLLVKKNSASGLMYITEMDNGRTEDKQDHLSCYIAGSLALGAYTHPDGLGSDIAQRDLRTAKSIAYTCYQMYAQSKTGIAPEAIWFGKKGFEKRRHAVYYILRPETAESLFILYTLTGDPVYREWGWEMFLAILQHCKTDLAFGSLKDVDNVDLPIDDKMESFFFAETLKYLYLLQDPDHEIDILEKHVFNTEAHPLRIRT